ncbi:MAG: DegT/DnrJ/EryC1/StrS family aminotransferase [Anaerolineae bacterium]
MPDDGEGIRLALEREDIKSRPLWKPMHLQPVFRGYEAILPRPLPAREGRSVAEALFRDGLCLPSGAAMSEADLARVVEVVRSLHSTHPPTWPLTHPPPRATPPAQPTSPLRSAPDL